MGVKRGAGRGIGDRRSLALRAWPQSSALCSEAQPSSGQEKGELSESCCPTQRNKKISELSTAIISSAL